MLLSNQDDYTSWTVDSDATDHIIFSPSDFVKATKPRRTSIITANGITYPVIGPGTIVLSQSLSLSKTLLILSLSINICMWVKLLKIKLYSSNISYIFPFSRYSLKRSLDMVLRKRGYTIWMTPTPIELITCNIWIVSRKILVTASSFGAPIIQLHETLISSVIFRFKLFRF